MKTILASILFFAGLSSVAGACPNFTGVYADSSDRQDQQVWTQRGCSSINVATRITGDPYLGTVDLDGVTWVVGHHTSPSPMKVTDSFAFSGNTFVADYVGYEVEDGVACHDRHIYSLDSQRNLVQRNVYSCGSNVILDTEATTPRL